MKDGVETQTVRDDIIAAMEKHDEPNDAVQSKQAEPAIETSVDNDEKPSKPKRDEKGKFSKVDEEDKGADGDSSDATGADPVDETKAESDSNEGEAGEPLSQEVKRPPQALSASIKGKWADIPEDVKNEFIRLESASAKGVASLKQDAHIGRELMEEIRPYEALIQSAGGTPKTAVRNLLQTAAILRTGTPAQKQNAVIGIIREYGIQLNGLEPVQEDPYMAEISRLRNDLAALQQAPVQQQESQIISTVEAFLAETDERGNPKYPLDERLEPEFADEIASVRRLNPRLSDRDVLDQAYERMAWKVPELRQTRLERQQAELEAKRKEKAAQEVAKKQSAAVSVKGTSATSAPQSDLTVRQLIEQQVYGGDKRV
jgi:hypothetical protein